MKPKRSTVGRATAAGCARILLAASLLGSSFGVAAAAQNLSAVIAVPSKYIVPASEKSQPGLLKLDNLFYETGSSRVALPAELVRAGRAKMPDGRTVSLSIAREDSNFIVRLSAQPDNGITRWGLSIEAGSGEFFTGVMERVVDGPQQASWAPGQTHGMNLHGQKIDMLVKPTTSVYAPFYLSSRGYAVFVKGTWPGVFDFAAANPARVGIEFEGPAFEMKVYTAADPASLVRAHALDAGPPFLPPNWVHMPWRWRDEHTQRAAYYDGTPVTGPFNSEVMEDVLLMRAFGIPNGVYWIDRPWGPGRLGYDDFEIDRDRLPNFETMVHWFNQQDTHVLLWIGPFFQGRMEKEAIEKHLNLPGQQSSPNNYPLADFTRPDAKQYWQDGVAKLLKMGITGFKLDRSEEDIPDGGPFKVFDGRSLRENRNAYPAMYLKAAYDVTKKFHPGGDFVLMPRAAYTGSAPYGVFWGGDIGGTQEGLRAEIIAVQRSAVMGYPNWGSDTCGYNQQLLEQEVCGRWLEFSAFTPIMEVGPTCNVGFWNLPRPPSYDAELIAIWRMYARIHQRLAGYSHSQAQVAHETGMPIVRPLFLIDPKSPQAWTDWETYLYGPDLLVSPIWEKGKREKQVYLPSGAQWRDAWHTSKVYRGGQTITIAAELHELPIFVRVGSGLELGDLSQQFHESLTIAQSKPDLKKLDASVKAWFDNYTHAAPAQ